ncbi:aspartate-alanine antiporter [Branchiibius sp. NY16-3462-2]|uniref:aspartate-alanine antiporter n=1 Tax=Branchiibius sp. NY16-3462-2 TaxID=1807500 RepID=UPI00079C0281|nr:aspartate-alanine antiporter [Branchiibius sp. NY16-3462-2]KYH45098.1 aspartate-alanine antiporter [Branchiibius sp. NY16-3462-2]
MSLLRDHAELAIFLCIAGGYLVGKLHLGPIKLGGICGTLIVALLIGTQHVKVDNDVKVVFFALFIFSLGYMAGPQFFANLNKRSLRFMVLCLIELVSVLSIAFLLAKAFKLDLGTASGILAGAATESAVVGTATEAIGNVPGLTAKQITQYQNNVATGYTVCYFFGLITIVLLTSQIYPLLLRINLRDECRKIAESMRGSSDAIASDEELALPYLVGRTFQVSEAAGKTVGAVESALNKDVSVESVRRVGAPQLSVDSDLVLQSGDTVLLVGGRSAAIQADSVIGPEVAGDAEAQSRVTTKQVTLTEKEVDGKTLEQLQDEHGELRGSGVFVTDLIRSTDQHLPMTPATVLRRGDIVTLVGARAAIDRFVKKVGVTVTSNATDYIYLGLGIVIGSLIGQLSIKLGDVPLSLGTGGGCLVSGLIFGWFRSRTQVIGAYPPQAATTLKDLGLSIFIACTGLAAGPEALPMLKQHGLLLPLAGIGMVLVPATISLIVGRKLLSIQDPILLGAIAGQQCSTPAITSLTQTADSSVPMLGYTITYALSNFLLPLTGPILVALLVASK